MQSKFDALAAGFAANMNPDHATRDGWLANLAQMIQDNTEAIIAAISEDFGHRAHVETRFGEIINALDDIKHTRKHLKKWMRNEKRKVGMNFIPAKAEIRYQPKGVVGVISPWNYPFSMAINPSIGALAAGNRVMIKPSELTPKTSDLIQQLVEKYFAPDVMSVITGGAGVAAAFTAMPFNHLFFTGSTRVGSLVMQAAAKNLATVTLELGGKSPTVIDDTYDMKTAVEKIASGKLFNSGQTCVAPDYVLVPKERETDFVGTYQHVARTFYPKIHDNPDFTAIVSEGHYDRLMGLVEDARDKGATITEIYPEEAASSSNLRKLPPKIVTNVKPDMAIMQEEIFGPLLPVIPYDTPEEARNFINARPRPLAMYGFSSDREFVEDLLHDTIAGGVSINDTILHIVQNDLPFGGVGASGMGSYHGHDGFKTFSHAKSVFHQAKLNSRSLLYPPYGKKTERILDFLG